ncbi:hypothetical protein ACFX1R_015417 [Malus domestica]
MVDFPILAALSTWSADAPYASIRKATVIFLLKKETHNTKSIILLHKVRIMVANSNHDFVEQMLFHSKKTSKVRIRECTVTDKIIVEEIHTSSLPASIKVYGTVGPADLSHILDDSMGM